MPMKAIVILLLMSACWSNKTGGSNDGTGAGSGSASGSGSGSSAFMLSGTLSDPLGSVSNQRAIVGISHESDVSGSVDCSKMVVKWDQTVPSLPATYTLADVPVGTWFLVAILPVKDGNAPFGVLELTVDHAGIHNNSQSTTSTVDIAVGGTTSYACP